MNHDAGRSEQLDGLTAAGQPLWMVPEVSSVGRVSMRVPLVAFSDEASARTADPLASHTELAAAGAEVLSLDGPWDFRWFERPGDVPASAVQPGDVPSADDGRSGWCRLDVPGNWPLQGTQQGLDWDVPIYTNVRMPFTETAPAVPHDNPTGVYRRTVTVPRQWTGSRVVLTIGGAESVAFVYVDGTCVGMAKDSRMPSEFDITGHVRPGRRSTIAVVVVKWSDASHIEDQDQWWMAGLHRSVHLHATGAVHLADVHAVAGWNAGPADRGATLAVHTTVGFDAPGGTNPEPGWTVTAHLETLGGKRITQLEPMFAGGMRVPAARHPYLFRGHNVHLVAPPGVLGAVRAWSAERPELYRVMVRLHDPNGDVAAVVAQRVGFRSVQVRDRALLINGEPVSIRGVNRHDHHPDRGSALTVEDIRADLVAIKAANMNAVRCAHYPNDHRLLDLCDELGLYVVDEANVESHAANLSLCHDPRYHGAIVERVARMVLRDRNHASVIMWSLGNEAGYGAAHDAAAAWVRRVDPTRVLHYEGALMEDLHADAPVTDVVCPMYASVDAIVDWSTRRTDLRRPLILCEFSHAMGNSNGGLADYVDAFESHEGLQGGFIWEFKDHGLRQHLPDGSERFAYGGQFGDTPNDANFVADGLFGPDLTAHPGLSEWAWLCRPVTVTLGPGGVERGRIVVTNRQWFTDISWLVATWELAADGHVVAHGPMVIPVVAPRTSRSVTLPDEVRSLLRAAAGTGRWPANRVPLPGAELHLTVSFATRGASAWAPRGHQVGWDQIPMGHFSTEASERSSSRTSTRAASRSAAQLAPGGTDGGGEVPVLDRGSSDGDGLVRLTVGALTVEVDPIEATVARIVHDGHELVTRGPRLELFRAAIDNDGLKLAVGSDDPWWVGEQFKPLARWMAAGLDAPTRLAVSVMGLRSGETTTAGVRLVRELALSGDVTIRHTETVVVDSSGMVTFDEAVRIPAVLDDLPRVGVSMQLPAELDQLSWLGLGPLENYPDRRSSSVVGRFTMGVDDTYVPYVMPQHHGTRGHIRWTTLTPSTTTGGSRPGVLVAPAPATVGADDQGAPADVTPLWITTRRLTDEHLWAAVDTSDLPAGDERATLPVTVTIDSALRGLGTGSCGPDTDVAHQVRAGWHRWRWVLAPWRASHGDPSSIVRR
jgi:beta-galactosidase